MFCVYNINVDRRPYMLPATLFFVALLLILFPITECGLAQCQGI